MNQTDPSDERGLSVSNASARRFLIVATNEGGSDIQPLLAIAAGLLARGHGVAAFGDAAVAPKMAPLGITTTGRPRN